MKDELIALILEILRGMETEIAPTNGGWTSETSLFGQEGILDSIGLVTLVVAVEQGIEDRYGAFVSLADDKAFAQKTSPFRSVGSLAEYAAQIIQP
jgi:acyl carrier protein